MGKVGKVIAGIVLIGGAVALGVIVPGTPFWVVALGSLGANLALSGLKPTPSFGSLASTRDNRVNITSTIAALPVVYGEALIGVKLVDLRQDTDASLFIVAALCHGSEDGSGIEAINEIYFDDVLAVNASGTVQSPFAGTCTVTKYLGTDSQTADSSLTTRFAGIWDSTGRGRGVAYLVIRLQYNPTIYARGLPQITARVRGVKLYDPRTTTSAFPGATANPALVVRDYLVSTRYGVGAASSEINDADIISAANYCDDLVTAAGSGTWARYRAAGVVDTAQQVTANTALLLTACRGALVWQGGKLRVIIRRAQSSVGFALTEDLFVGGVSFSLPGLQDRKNQMVGAMLDPAQAGQPREVPYPRNGASNAYLTEDNGFPIVGQIELPFTPTYERAEQLLAVLLAESRAAVAVQCTLLESAYVLEVGDVVNVTHSTLGWTAKPMWVMGIAPRPDRTIVCILGEYDSTAYTVPTLSLVPTAPGTTPPDQNDLDDRVIGTISGPGTLAPGSGADDGATSKAITKGYQTGTARHGDAITFGTAYQNVPTVRITGGLLSQPGAKYGTAAQVDAGTAATARASAPEYEDVGAVDLSASGFKVRARLKQSGTATARTNDFPSSDNLTAVNQDSRVALANAPSYDDQYRVSYRVAQTFTAKSGTFQSATITIYVETSPDNANWTTRATRSDTIDDDNTSGSSSGSSSTNDYTEVVTVTGVASSWYMRVKVFAVVKGVLSSHTFSVKGYGATGTPSGGVTYTTASGAQFASKTPDTADRITWESWTNA